MSRKSNRPAWTPNPECEAALRRVTETAHLCAAALFGEKPTDDPSANASPRALMHAMGMMYFLMRIDPADLAALTTGPGSTADWSYAPFPPGFRTRKPMFEAMLRDVA